MKLLFKTLKTGEVAVSEGTGHQNSIFRTQQCDIQHAGSVQSE